MWTKNPTIKRRSPLPRLREATPVVRPKLAPGFRQTFHLHLAALNTEAREVRNVKTDPEKRLFEVKQRGTVSVMARKLPQLVPVEAGPSKYVSLADPVW